MDKNKLKEIISKLKNGVEKITGGIGELEKNMDERSNSKSRWNKFDDMSCIVSIIILILIVVFFKNSLTSLNYIADKLSWNLAFGYFISVICGSFIIRVIMRILKYKIPNKDVTIGTFTLLLGPLEAFAFTTAWAFKHPSFIAIWLGIKMAGRWGKKEKPDEKGEINTFLIGNLLNICFSIIAGQIIKQGL